MNGGTPTESTPEDEHRQPGEINSARGSSHIPTPLERAWIPPERNLADHSEIKGVMAQFSPMAGNDLVTIEKGMENFFLFNSSHLALFEEERLAHLQAKELEVLEKRNVLVRFQYLNLTEEGELNVVPVVIRPASLRGDQVSRAKNACIRGSAIALIRYLDHRNSFFEDLDRQGRLSDLIVNRLKSTAPEDQRGRPLEFFLSIENLASLSFDRLLERELNPLPQLLHATMVLLSSSSRELLQDLEENTDLAAEVRPILEKLEQRPVVYQFSPRFHIPAPSPDRLVEVDGNNLKDIRTELEWIYLIYVKSARKFLLNLLAPEQATWIEKEGTAQDQKYLEELMKHPSFLSGDHWPDADLFMQEYEALIREVHGLNRLRKGYTIGMITDDVLKKLNGLFSPYLFSRENFSIPDALKKKVRASDEIFQQVLTQIKLNDEVFSMGRANTRDENNQEEVYLLYKYNVPGAFIQNPDIRAMIHSLAKKNGVEGGIYGYLIDVDEQSHSRRIVKDQMELMSAIREWEAELEKERLRKERQNQSFISMLADFIADLIRSLFGSGSSQSTDLTRMESSHVDPTSESHSGTEPGPKSKRKTGVIAGPREKKIVIPNKVQKAVDYVERNNKGLIWLEEVLYTLNSVKYTENMIGDFLYFDQKRRYIEIKFMMNIKRVFIQVSNDESDDWNRSVVEYLENLTSPTEATIELLKYFKTRV